MNGKRVPELFRKPLINILLIVLIGVLAYSNTIRSPFVLDDAHTIVANHQLRDPGSFSSMSGPRWFGFLTFALNYRFGGLDPTGYHTVNLVIHILNALLVYSLVVLTFRTHLMQPMESGLDADKIALLSGLLFVSHPVQTQAVTYIVQRFASLATLFYLLSLVAYIKARCGKTGEERPVSGAQSVLFYMVSVASAVIAMKTKEISLTLPLVIALYEFSFLGKGTEGKFKRLLCLLPLLLTLFIIPMGRIDMNKPVEHVLGEVEGLSRETTQIPRWSYLFTQFRVVVTYIRLLFFPVNQNLDYDYPIYHSFLQPEVFLSFLMLSFISGLGLYLHWSSRCGRETGKGGRRLVAFGILWFFITLSVESSVIPIKDVIFEHRVYLPSVGIFIGATTGVFMAVSKRGFRNAVAAGLLAAVMVFSVAAYSRNKVWQSQVALWTDVVSKSPGKARPHVNLGDAYYTQLRLEEAVEEYRTAIRLDPLNQDAHNNIGSAYEMMGDLDKAANEFRTAISLGPKESRVHYNLGFVYQKQGRLDEAINEYRTAIGLDLLYPEAHNNLGSVYEMQGRLEEAISEFQLAVKLNPGDPNALKNLAIIYEKLELRGGP